MHLPSLLLDRAGWTYSEPGPYNPPGNARRQPGTPLLTVDLADPRLPQPRLRPSSSAAVTLAVPAFTDFKLHDITDPAQKDAAEPLDINQPGTSRKFLAGNRRFLTSRLWGVGNMPPYFHHGLFTTLREAVMAHAGEAAEERRSFESLSAAGQEALMDFLQSLQVLPPDARQPVR